MSDPMTASEIEAIRQRVEKATEGPWVNLDETQSPGGWDRPLLGRLVRAACHTTEEAVIGYNNYDASPRMLLEDREFVAHARTDIPSLLAELDRRAGLMREAASNLGRFAMRQEFSPGIGNYDQCRICSSCGTPIVHSPDCLIERLRTAGEG